MQTVWGVDSLGPADTVIGKTTVYDIVVANKKRRPAFWGRYIAGAKENLSQKEASFLERKGCRILPIVTFGDSGQISGDRDSGRKKAGDAVAAARALHMPGGFFINADIEPLWQPSALWIMGWWDVMRESEYGGYGGLYCNNAPINAFFNNPYRDALRTYATQYPAVKHKVFLWAQTPPSRCDVDPGWPAEHTSDGARVWQYALGCIRGFLPGEIGLVDMDLATLEGFRHMWGTESHVHSSEQAMHSAAQHHTSADSANQTGSGSDQRSDSGRHGRRDGGDVVLSDGD